VSSKQVGRRLLEAYQNVRLGGDFSEPDLSRSDSLSMEPNC